MRSPWLARFPVGLFAIPVGLFALAYPGWAAGPIVAVACAVIGFLAYRTLLLLLHGRLLPPPPPA
jgi:hypothetical protein